MKRLLICLLLVGVLGCGKEEHTETKATAGDKLWEFETGGFLNSSPAIGSDGTVYVLSLKHIIRCLRAI